MSNLLRNNKSIIRLVDTWSQLPYYNYREVSINLRYPIRKEMSFNEWEAMSSHIFYLEYKGDCYVYIRW